MKKNLNLHIGKKKHLNLPFLCTEELARMKKSWIWAVLSGTETIGHFLLDFLVIHKVKWIKRVLIWWKLKDDFFSHQNGIKWSLMDIRKLKIYFQTKTDFLDDFLPKGSLCCERESTIPSIRLYDDKDSLMARDIHIECSKQFKLKLILLQVKNC